MHRSRLLIEGRLPRSGGTSGDPVPATAAAGHSAVRTEQLVTVLLEAVSLDTLCGSSSAVCASARSSSSPLAVGVRARSRSRLRPAFSPVGPWFRGRRGAGNLGPTQLLAPASAFGLSCSGGQALGWPGPFCLSPPHGAPLPFTWPCAKAAQARLLHK